VILRSERILGTDLGDVVDGWIRVEDDHIAEVGRGVPPADAGPVTQVDGWLMPGLVDIHVHGAAGRSFDAGDPAAAARIAEHHRQHGTTTLVASLVTASIDDLVRAVTGLAPAVDRGDIVGIHLEGPYLAASRCGAHEPSLLIAPSLPDVSRLIEAGPVAMVTIAPELPGALDAIRYLADHGVVAALGHTDATYEQTLAGIGAGATHATHLFNGMRPLHHRDPGPIAAILEREDVTFELINDGEHLHGALVTGLLGHTSDRVALITDAVAATGLPDGEYELGGLPIVVRAGRSELTATGSLAGATIVLADAVRRAVRAGTPAATAVRAATATPARVLGLAHTLGSLRPGLRADLVAADADFRVDRVWVRGGRVA